MSASKEVVRSSTASHPSQGGSQQATAQQLQERLMEAEAQMRALQQEIQRLRENLQHQNSQSLPETQPRNQRPQLMALDSQFMKRPRATRGDIAAPLFQATPEPLSAPSSEPLWRESRGDGDATRANEFSWNHPGPRPATPTGPPISASMGEPMPPGYASPGPEMPPPALLHPAEMSPRQQAISMYHQQPFFVDAGYVSQLSPEELDDLPYGVIQLDAEGRILAYNDTEARLAGYPKERVIGRNFFAIAPCTRVREFEGRFRDLAEGRKFSLESFEFVFNFKKGAQRVLIMIFPANRRRGVFNITLIRK